LAKEVDMKRLFLLLVGLLIAPVVIAEPVCQNNDSASYERCMMDSIANQLLNSRYNYAMDLLNTYEDWYRSQKKTDIKSLGRIYSNRAAIKYMKGDYESALNDYEGAINLYRSAYDIERAMEAVVNKGVVIVSMNRYDEAIKVIKEAEEYYRKNNRIIDLSDVLFTEGIIYFFDNKISDALSRFSESSNLYLKANLKIRYLLAQVLQGIMKAKLGEYKEAAYLCQENILSSSLKYYCIALANDGMGNQKEAKMYFEKALSRIDTKVNQTLINSDEKAAQALSEKYAPIFTDYMLFMLKNSIKSM
jgi:tetratricopeptide (TPR) repeat protein